MKISKEFGLHLDAVRLIDPVDSLSFLQLENNAKLVLTDSGEVQEEACVLGLPCVTLRDNTERSETVEVSSNVLAGNDSDRILECVKMMVVKVKRLGESFRRRKRGQESCRIVREKCPFGT